MLTTDDPTAETRFAAIDSVDDVELKDGKLTIRGSKETLIGEVIRCISENEMHVSDFRTVLPTLEDVFLRVTGHSIRD